MGKVAVFLAGLVTGVILVVLAGWVTLSGLGSVADAPPASPRPTPSATPTPGPGQTVIARGSLTSSQVLTTEGTLQDVTASGEGLTLSDKGIHANRLTITATLPFAVAAQQVGEGVDLYAAGSGRAGVRRTVDLLGQQVLVTATGDVRAVNGQLVITPVTVDLGGPDWLDSVASAAAREFVSIKHTVQGLPDGMRLIAVSVADDGFHARLEGSDITIGR